MSYFILGVALRIVTCQAPSDEGAVSEADWGRENPKASEVYRNTDKTATFSLPQSPSATAPSSEGALGAPAPEGFRHAQKTSQTPLFPV